jgi:hypothetical protein
MFVVVWEPKSRVGGGHQLVMDLAKAEKLRWQFCHTLPNAEIKVLSAEAHAAAAVLERQQRRGRR